MRGQPAPQQALEDDRHVQRGVRVSGVQRRAETGATRAEDQGVGVEDVDHEPRSASVRRSHLERQQDTTELPRWMREASARPA